MPLPQILDTGDGVTIDRDLALEATHHILIAMKLVLELPTLRDELHLDLADQHVSEILGGDHWRPIAHELVNAALEQEASNG
ncbi:hypothetical protein [Synechococcus sp. RS9902]|uniref:hypothetical protein n=1 Tax=Synechococcus sp. RS9902 TaxID=221345 RepID=UPI0016451891|nr:hypothetical protein [Synechococcus sp. RS9902]QNI98410.1 hypothetical protein SynRS9902_02539 [Synechococcus sp. RS9902]